MSKRLQVILDDSEYRGLQRQAHKDGLSVSEWVRRALRTMRRREPHIDTARKLKAVREGTRHSYPTGDIAQMLAEIEAGYGGDNP